MTPLEHQLLGYVGGYIEANGFAPTYTEMAEACGRKSKSGVHRMVVSLIAQRKLIRTRANFHRNLALPGKFDGFTTAELQRELIRRGALAA